MTSENVIPFSTMKEQVGKKKVTHRPSKWVYPTTTQTEDEFHTSDEIPYGTSFSTIKKQLRKKGVSKKSKKERVSAKSVSLSERLGSQPYK